MNDFEFKECVSLFAFRSKSSQGAGGVDDENWNDDDGI